MFEIELFSDFLEEQTDESEFNLKLNAIFPELTF